jgi:hypothetical protein
VLGELDGRHDAGVAGVRQQRHAPGDGLDGHLVDLLALLDGEGHPLAAGAVASDRVDAHLDLPVDPGLGALVVDAVVLVQRLDDAARDAGKVLARPFLGFMLAVFHWFLLWSEDVVCEGR